MITAPARRVFEVEDLERAGDYCLSSVTGYEEGPETRRAVWFLLPTHEGATMYDRPTRASGLHMVSEPPWVFTEQTDGSVEVRESIACGRHDAEGEYFHGYLDAGNVWRIL